MPSQLQSDTARTNGGKSHGPVTPEGRATSSRNSLRHGLTAKAVVLPGESEEDFQSLLDDHVDQFQPATGVEFSLVQTLAVARWRLNRIAGIETNLFNNKMITGAKLTDLALPDMPNDDHRLARAFQSLSEDHELVLLLRYEATLTRSYDRALKQLDQLQRARKAAAVPIGVNPRPSVLNQGAKPESRNEPEPTPTADSTGLTPAQPDRGPAPEPSPTRLLP
jgi:hypothetical protein